MHVRSDYNLLSKSSVYYLMWTFFIYLKKRKKKHITMDIIEAKYKIQWVNTSFGSDISSHPFYSNLHSF